MSEQNGPPEGPGWWPPAQSWKSSSAPARPEAGKNVSVTTINVPPAHEMHDGKNVKYLGGRNGVTVSVVSGCGTGNEPEDDGADSDGEVSKIDFRGVNLRTKKKRDAPEGQESDASTVTEAMLQQPERPMSWEGELSDQEMSSNTITNQDHEETSMEGVQVCSASPGPTLAPPEPKFAIKLEPDFRSSPGPPLGPPNEVTLSTTQQQHQQQQHQQQQQQQQLNIDGLEQTQQSDLPLLVGKLLGGYNNATPNHSPVLNPRHHLTKHSHTRSQVPSPDSAIHSAYSVFSSPTQSPHAARHSALGAGSPVPSSSLSLSRHSFNNSTSSLSLSLSHSLSRNNSDASSSCYSYGSLSPPTHSPVQQPRHSHSHTSHPHHQVAAQGSPLHLPISHHYSTTNSELSEGLSEDQEDCKIAPAAAGISTRQQLINSPCPICGDKISGFHYGIFSCESCKGFFKRTVQNRKNYVCLRGAGCSVTVATRKKCPACRFEKCLNMGMKLEAIREDRTRGGRSTYQCSYTLPANLVGCTSGGLPGDKMAGGTCSPAPPGYEHHHSARHHSNHSHKQHVVPQLLQEIMDVEHLWHYNDNDRTTSAQSSSSSSKSEQPRPSSAGPQNTDHDQQHPPSNANTNANSSQHPDFLSNLCNIADHRLYKIVKWCKSLPLFKNISIDDQICLLINSWCELLLFSCCFRSVNTPGEIRVSLGKSITLEQARQLGLASCIERMLAFTNNLRRLRVDQYEYVAMKVIVLLTSDTSELKEPEKVRASQEKALQALQQYTIAMYPEMPAKFGELLLRIPDLQRTCQAGKELLSAKRAEGEGSSFNLLMELLRGDH
ncbi:nuclear hormone receptor FTZ-F1 beta [Neodiprion pinetum]|uniref:nuclear hormone receptor FTZ-F1 beta n=1 Tax=Neodiprion fabricii TaxID=2872261 RepID=UPI001ED9327D|nr:nuclear hormone receptor FTZ-F1 beta [Neodiprion fabricii]XP_046415566.1 nuclear hormone receptor FTZ-F1 beta [Neodiprion fabricii]XP_046475250.1 nuclear hormone receptor FTZ-F1 beta [Neodiprion pinetum]XP_046475251.1 nuclear hormone receptor FTZ-F1 beta [Neodiprion pinetum]XP_046609489.1 nuclear hormone receptor FTZ-F1 beta [Neodiprion virginianus]XP_046609490.1 nuclear hormone receptor FTZ-F1 beta [Neodiprion virginianus]